MAIEQFIVQPSSPNVMYILAVSLIVVGAILLVLNVLLWGRFKGRPTFGGKMIGYGVGVNSKYGLAILGVCLIGGGGVVCGAISVSSSPSIVTVGDGYINVESNAFTHVGAIFNIKSSKNVTSEEITTAFISQVGSDNSKGDFKLHKTYGYNFGDANIGLFALGNGATAYVVTTNSTSLIIELKNGEYIIVGSSDTQTIADSFSQNVHPILTPQQ
ncbi:MAG: hypothetical protein LBC03_01160 [Nitrososphaerota archaeon]|jgi:hypothetical protein|nr:hypothetical protein [Nitrososphaerota archaeon]